MHHNSKFQQSCQFYVVWRSFDFSLKKKTAYFCSESMISKCCILSLSFLGQTLCKAQSVWLSDPTWHLKISSNRAGTGAAGILNSKSSMFWMNGFANQFLQLVARWLMGKHPIVWRIVWQQQHFAFMRSRGWLVESPERHWWSLISSTFLSMPPSHNQVFLCGTSNIFIFSTFCEQWMRCAGAQILSL